MAKIQLSDPMSKDEFLIQDLETLKVISHPMRLDLVKLFKKPRTVKQVSALIDTVPTKLYYHVNLLEQHGILNVTETNIVSGIIEKTYQVSARRFRVDEAMLGSADHKDEKIETTLNVVIDTTREELRRSLIAENSEDSLKNKTLVRTHLRLSKADVETFRDRFEALIMEYEALSEKRPDTDEESRIYNLTSLFFPVVNPFEEEE